jgi:hypothetical protein
MRKESESGRDRCAVWQHMRGRERNLLRVAYLVVICDCDNCTK